MEPFILDRRKILDIIRKSNIKIMKEKQLSAMFSRKIRINRNDARAIVKNLSRAGTIKKGKDGFFRI
jgi:hypothetical protein